MASVDEEGDKAVEQWKIRKLIQKLEQARGYGAVARDAVCGAADAVVV